MPSTEPGNSAKAAAGHRGSSVGTLGVLLGDLAHKPWWFAAKMKRTSLLCGKSPHFLPQAGQGGAAAGGSTLQ